MEGHSWDEVHPEDIFLLYVSNDYPNEKLMTYLLSIINPDKIDMLCSKMYPDKMDIDREQSSFDITVPSYNSEKIILPRFPVLSKYSGHNLLHAAIDYADVDFVRELVLQNKALLEEKTNPIHDYMHPFYGEQPYTPLELAKRKYNIYKSRSKRTNSRLIIKIIQKSQIKKIQEIIHILECELRSLNTVI